MFGLGVLAPAVSSLVTGATAFLSNASASLGVGKLATTVIGKSTSLLNVVAQIPKINPETVITVVKTTGKIIDNVCDRIIGVKSDNSEILGAKSIQSQKPLDNFETTKEYIEYLNKQKLDEEKYNNLNTVEKLGCNLRGIGLKTKAVEESIESEFKGKFNISEDFLVTLAKTAGKVTDTINIAGTAVDIVDMLKGLKKNGIDDTSDVSDYIEGKISSNIIKAGIALKNTFKDMGIINPENCVELMKKLARNYIIN